MAEPRWLDEPEARMWRAYCAMHRELDTAVDRQLLRDGGLSSADYAVLVPLSEAAEQQLRARDLGRQAGWDRSRLSHQLRRMEQRGLVSRHECATDARGTIIRLTSAGREAIQAAAPGHVETVREYFVDLLTAAEIETVTSIAERALGRLRQDASICDESCG